MKWTVLVGILLPILNGNYVRAEETKPAGKMAFKEFSKEEREKMAATHEKMAVCLRSEKSLADCRDEMRNTCLESMEKESCSMWEKGSGRGWRKGMMRRGARNNN